MGNKPSEGDERPKLEQEIEDNLRKAFDDIANEPLPDRFASLLDQLKGQKTSERNG